MFQEVMPGKMMAALQMVADMMEGNDWDFLFQSQGDRPRFEGVQIWLPETAFLPSQIYVFPEGTPLPDRFPEEGGCVFFGQAPENCPAPYLVVTGSVGLFPVLNLIQQIFQRCHDWDARLCEIMMADGSLHDLCCAAIDYFDNPVYIHDSFFNVLAQPQWVQGMLPLEETSGGRHSVPLDLINEFQTSHDYIGTLNYTTAQIWGVDQVCYGMRSLYVNLLDNQKYRGRILVNEIRNPLRPGDSYALEHFAQYVMLVLRRDRLLPHGRYLMFEDVLKAYVSGEAADMVEIRRCLDAIQWNFNDTYLCLRLYPHQREPFFIRAAAALCSTIDICLKSSMSFFDGETIWTIANLTHGSLDAADCRMRLAPIIRESLFYCGTSNPFSPFTFIKDAFQQAQIALDAAHTDKNTQWYMAFHECAVEYMLSTTEKVIPAELFSAPELIQLRKLDKEKGTDYFNTLKTYLYCKMDVNEASKTLFIHRTTLNYRLEKIFSQFPIKLDTPIQQMYFLLSAIMLERSDQHRDAHAHLMPR